MKLWLLRPIDNLETRNNPWVPWYDKAFGFVVRAETEEDARRLADLNSGNEMSNKHIDPWLDPSLSSCIELTSDGREEMIIRDFAAA